MQKNSVMNTVRISAEINAADIPIFETLFKKFKAKKVAIETKNIESLEDLEDLKAIEERKSETSHLAKDVFTQIRAKRNG